MCVREVYVRLDNILLASPHAAAAALVNKSEGEDLKSMA
jgi:hypothetical protein